MLTAHQTAGDGAAKNKLASNTRLTMGQIALWETQVKHGEVVQGRNGDKHNAT